MTRKVDREGRGRRVRVEVLMEGVRGNCLVVGGNELVELDGKEV